MIWNFLIVSVALRCAPKCFVLTVKSQFVYVDYHFKLVKMNGIQLLKTLYCHN